MIASIRNSPRAPVLQPFILGGLALVATAMAAGLTFAGWEAYGPSLLNALSLNGLAWCF